MHNQRIAEVVVDVPTSQTNKAYSYYIPIELEEVAIGSRVKVSFGNRFIQGYIIGIRKVEPFPRKLKPIEEILDFTPTLTQELVKIGQDMADEYLCHTITAFHAMVPAILKGKTKKLVYPRHHFGSSLPIDIASVFKENDSIEWGDIITKHGVTPQTLKKWVKEDKIYIEETLSDRVTLKRKTWVWTPHSKEFLQATLDKIPNSAHQQRRILSFFSTSQEKVALSHLLTILQTNRAVVKKLVEKGWLWWEEKEEYRDPFGHKVFKKTTPLSLTDEQKSVYLQIVQSIHDQKFQSFLLQGVTGSGKTEVYLQAIEQVLVQGREAIVLVPEISLTPQMVNRFKGRFGERVAVLHSRLSNGERYDEWRKIRYQKVSVVIGARSAVFAPFLNLGLIIVDEEHETSYKQEENPKYDAREIALWRTKQHNAVLVLGSATPAIESYYSASKGKHTWLRLTERVQGRPFPEVHVVDMRSELKKGNRSIFSLPLQENINACLKKEEQIVLFLNRRGFATFVMCRDCGEVIKCSHCDISLTYHQTNNTLRCHYCGFSRKIPHQCPACQSQHIRHFGTGTQRVEQELLRSFPGIQVIRMDVDTTSRKGDHEKLLTAFAEGKAQVLLGTQMIAKGLDFPSVTLVGVLAADSSLHLPDYRAAERTFQLLVQVSGRAGRHDKPGKVIIQTYNGDHYSIKKASQNEVDSFYHQECMLRKKNLYPPYCGLYMLLLSHENRVYLLKASQEIAQYLKKEIASGLEFLGPVPSAIPRMKDQYRLQITIKVSSHFQEIGKLKEYLREIQAIALNKKIRLSIAREYLREE